MRLAGLKSQVSFIYNVHYKDGWCWWYRKYAPLDTELEKLEKLAREARKGLWADPQPMPPWEWRKRKYGGSG